MKHTWLGISAMSLLILLLLVIIGLVIGKLGSIEPADQSETEVYEVGTQIIDRRCRYPDSFELLYKTTYSNGLSVEQWQEVDWNDYITLWEER